MVDLITIGLLLVDLLLVVAKASAAAVILVPTVTCVGGGVFEVAIIAIIYCCLGWCGLFLLLVMVVMPSDNSMGRGFG